MTHGGDKTNMKERKKKNMYISVSGWCGVVVESEGGGGWRVQ